jgi:hypothetical protein
VSEWESEWAWVPELESAQELELGRVSVQAWVSVSGSERERVSGAASSRRENTKSRRSY